MLPSYILIEESISNRTSSPLMILLWFKIDRLLDPLATLSASYEPHQEYVVEWDEENHVANLAQLPCEEQRCFMNFMSDTWDEVTLFPCYVHSLSECIAKLHCRVEAQIFWALC
jgi:hypothetical protein